MAKRERETEPDVSEEIVGILREDDELSGLVMSRIAESAETGDPEEVLGRYARVSRELGYQDSDEVTGLLSRAASQRFAVLAEENDAMPGLLGEVATRGKIQLTVQLNSSPRRSSSRSSPRPGPAKSGSSLTGVTAEFYMREEDMGEDEAYEAARHITGRLRPHFEDIAFIKSIGSGERNRYDVTDKRRYFRLLRHLRDNKGRKWETVPEELYK